MTTKFQLIESRPRSDWFLPAQGIVRKNIVNWDEEKRDRPVPGVRVCLFSAYDEKYDCLAAIAEPNWAEYCMRHGYALRTYPGAFHLDPSRPETYGDKVKHSLYFDLRGLFDVVMFLDIDSLFVNMEKPIDEPSAFGPRLIWTYSAGGPMSGLMIMATDDSTEKHLRYAYEMAAIESNVRHGIVESNGISDQDAMTRLMNVPPFAETFRYCLEAESVGFAYPEQAKHNPWIVTCRGGSLEEKLATMQQLALAKSVGTFIGIQGVPTLAVPETRSPAQEAFDAGMISGEELAAAYASAKTRPDNGHKVAAYNPSAPFDERWAGPSELKPRVYRTQSEKDTAYAMLVENEYRLEPLQPDDVVIDIGAHIGTFTMRAYLSGSRSVYGYEIDPWHLEAAVANLAGMEDGAGVEHAAVVRGDGGRSAEYHYEGGWNSFAAAGTVVPSKSLDEIINEVCAPGEHVRFLKIDCEGGEYPILMTCTQLDRIDEIAGEWHLMEPGPDELINLPYATDQDGLSRFLQANGFDVEITSAGGNGGFWAKRPVTARVRRLFGVS